MNNSVCPIDIQRQDLILLAYRGSIAHGMYRPGTSPDGIDDIDLIGVVVPSLRSILTEYTNVRSVEIAQTIRQDEWDIVLYSLRKMVYMLKRSNPNVLSLLWLKPEHTIRSSEHWNFIERNRDLFVSKMAYLPFVEYARSQFTRMTSGAFLGYMGEKRKALSRKHGYDPKNAAHLIRLLRMGTEFLTTGELIVDRSAVDAEELLSIKSGSLSLADIQNLAKQEFTIIEKALERSPLPEKICESAIDDLLYEVSANYYKLNIGEEQWERSTRAAG